MSFTATPQQVERVISAVLPHVEPDGYHPALTCVRVELTTDTFIATATDRYTLAVCWASLTDWEEDAAPETPVAANIYARDWQRVFSFLKPHKKLTAIWDLTESGLTVSFGQESISVRTVDVDFVNWRAILPKLLDKPNGAIPSLGFDPLRIDAFTKSAKALGERSMRWRLGNAPTDAAVVEIGDHFLGVLMPVRLDEARVLDLSVIGVEMRKEIAA